MSFALKCPKCTSGNIVIEKDSRSYFQRAVPSLHCMMCGKIVYGEEAIEAEYLRQKAAYKNEVSAVKVEKRPDPKPARKFNTSRKPAKAPAPAEPPASNGITGAEPSKPETQGTCAWRECSKPSRDTSKYCSRACSNKNARWRHARRKMAREAQGKSVGGLNISSIATLRETQAIRG